VATKKKKTTAKKKNNSNKQLWSVLLFSMGVLMLFMSIIEGSSAWLALHNFVRGLFGIAVFLVPVILIYAAIMIATDKSEKAVAGKVIQGFILTALICGTVFIFMYGNEDLSAWENIPQRLYDTGVTLNGGGFFSIIIGVPLLMIFGKVGASIIILVLLFVFVMLLTNISLISFLGFFGKPFKKAGEAMKAAGESDAEEQQRRAEERAKQQKTAKKLPPNEPLPPEARKPKLENIDIPIPVEPKSQPTVDSGCNDDMPAHPVESPKEAVAEPKKEPAKKSAVDLDAIIKKAAGTPPPTTPPADAVSTVKTEDKPKEPEKPVIEDENGQTMLFEKPEPVKVYKYPPTSLLNAPAGRASGEGMETELKNSADTLVNTLKSFGVQTRIVDIHRGPSVTRYELQPSAGVKISKITGLADDIALNLAAAGVRIEAPIPGKAAVGIEVPNKTKDMVTLRELLESEEFRNSESKLTFALGRDIAGKTILGDIAKMPHVIIAGTTGSGKSVCTNSIIMSILFNASPDEVKLLLIDPKMVEFTTYNGIPHLLVPVVTDPRKAAGALNWAVQEMLKRYKLFADNNVRDLKGYNEMAKETEDVAPLPQIVIAIDELADLMMAASNEVEDAICRLAQMARAAGMHLIIATQRPTVDVITGLIKANIPSRIALTVSSQIDSRTIIDVAGAEKLLGNGDMLYNPQGIPKPVRVQGCFCSTKEVEKVVAFLKTEAQADYDDKIIKEIEENLPAVKGEKSSEPSSSGSAEQVDEMVEKAIEVVVENGQASTSLLQRKLKLGYARAARIIDELEELGVVGPFEGAKPRQVLISREQWYERRLRVQSENTEDAPNTAE